MELCSLLFLFKAAEDAVFCFADSQHLSNSTVGTTEVSADAVPDHLTDATSSSRGVKYDDSCGQEILQKMVRITQRVRQRLQD